MKTSREAAAFDFLSRISSMPLPLPSSPPAPGAGVGVGGGGGSLSRVPTGTGMLMMMEGGGGGGASSSPLASSALTGSPMPMGMGMGMAMAMTGSGLLLNLQHQNSSTAPRESTGLRIVANATSPTAGGGGEGIQDGGGGGLALSQGQGSPLQQQMAREMTVREQAAVDFLGRIPLSVLATNDNVTSGSAPMEGVLAGNGNDENMGIYAIPNSTSSQILQANTPLKEMLPHASMGGSGGMAVPGGGGGVGIFPLQLVNQNYNNNWGSEEDITGVMGANEGERASFYRSGGLAVKSFNRLSYTPNRYSEIAANDPLLVLTWTGGPVSLFSLIPPAKPSGRRQTKKGNNSNSNNINSIASKGAVSTVSSAITPYFSPYLERMGITSLNFDVGASLKLQRKKMAESFAQLLEPQGILSPLQSSAEYSTYDPYYLDHPDLKTGKNKTVITLPCFLGSIIQPSTASELKKELNQHFKEAHPDLNNTITLTHIRNLKALICRVGITKNLERSSVAFAYVYLEKLILKNFVNKNNKKLISAICLLLAVKVNDAKDTNYLALIETMEKEMEVAKKDIYANEFSVYTALEFSLFLPIWDVGPHLIQVESVYQLAAQTALDAMP